MSVLAVVVWHQKMSRYRLVSVGDSDLQIGIFRLFLFFCKQTDTLFCLLFSEVLFLKRELV